MISEARSMLIEDLFHDAVDLPPEHRRGFVDDCCGSETELSAELLRMLRCDEAIGDDFLKGPGADIRALLDAELEPGTTIGRYTLLDTSGEGAHGVVYRAEQSEPLPRTVAIKVLKPGMDSRQALGRFAVEQQVLALLDHPYIARIFDAGITDQGRPYFVTEYVAGTAIHEFCDASRYTAQGRMKLFICVCEAVQHAHQKGIIHRDLKPSNILVTMQDGRPVPKVVDFGIAKARVPWPAERALLTETDQLVGTPEYMSPEQAAMTADIDTRSDIYALGGVLYELLVGALPFDAKTLREAGFAEAQRIICEVDPPKPSTRLSSLGDDSTVSARCRRTDSGLLRRDLRGDVDWIIMKAMDKDRNRRYATANELAMDIRRHLEHEPVSAGPRGTVYRLRKFGRRHRVGVAAAASAFIVLVAGIVVATVFGLGQARARADAEAAWTAERSARADAEKRTEERAKAIECLAELYEAVGRPEDAAEWRAKLQ